MATAELMNGGKLSLRVMPAFVPTNTFLGGIYGVGNGVLFNDCLGPDTELGGPGAGGDPTAAAILGDLVASIYCLKHGKIPMEFAQLCVGYPPNLMELPKVEVRVVFQSRTILHKIGGLKEKLQTISNAKLDLEQVYTVSRSNEQSTPDILSCYLAPLKDILKAKKQIEELPSVTGPVKIFEILGTQPFDI